MILTMDAIFDGEVLRLEKPIELAPNTRVKVTIEAAKTKRKKRRSFLKTARSLNLQGPPDWSTRFEDYLYNQEQILDD